MQKTLGIILAAGKSTRLYPATLASTKQLLPIYDKPLIYYPLTTLMLMGIRDFIIISNPSEKDNFQKLFQNAKSELGIQITFLVQDNPRGIADAFNIVYDHLKDNVLEYDNHALILGDNIFYGAGLQGLLKNASSQTKTANIFVYSSQTPEKFGVVKLDGETVVSIEEKPSNPTSNFIVTGLYMYPPSVYLYTKHLLPSQRGELEITDLNKFYLDRGELKAHKLSRGTVWFDTGNVVDMLAASNFIHNIQTHQNYLVGSPHEIAITNGWVSKEEIMPFIETCSKTEYGKYLKQMVG